MNDPRIVVGFWGVSKSFRKGLRGVSGTSGCSDCGGV